jgi:lipoprotein NlpD
MRSYLFLILWVLCSCTGGVKAPVSSGTHVDDTVTTVSPTIRNRDVHIVLPGDTLYAIAWRYLHDYRDLALWNNIKSPYLIYPGQRISLKPVVRPVAEKTGKPAKQEIIRHTEITGDRKQHLPGNNRADTTEPDWRWPTPGKIVTIKSPTLEKGANITGKEGQAVMAAAAGEVVYSGSGLLGYGKLIIIKHNETYLSAYAHNKEILTREGNTVSRGEKIATMGTMNGMPILHFEIRKDSKPVDPLRYLPAKDS